MWVDEILALVFVIVIGAVAMLAVLANKISKK